MSESEIETFHPKSREQWRRWLQKNHEQKQSVWLLHYKKNSGTASISWDEAVEEALCFGWIDSKRKPVDEEKYIQFFSKRKLKGTWSKVNKEKVQRLIEKGLMSKDGLESIETAKRNGSWIILDSVEELEIPADLQKEFKKHKGASEFFKSLSKSVKKAMLQWIVLARRSETRQKRITEIAELAGQKLKPKQF